MKTFTLNFIRRGFSAAGIGPIILAILYLVLRQSSGLDTLTVDQVCIGIFSLTALAFVAGAMNAVYQVERLPLMAAIFIHGSVLYVGYLATYLVNDWLKQGVIPILVFTGIFVVGYFLIWSVIYLVIRKNTERVNQLLKQKQQKGKEA